MHSLEGWRGAALLMILIVSAALVAGCEHSASERNAADQFLRDKAPAPHQNPTREPASTISPDGPETVYVTNTGKCYHKEGCGSLTRSKIPMSKSDAVKQAYRACRRCNP